MLIIAIPKSASSSLLNTLGINHNLPFSQDFKLNEEYTVPTSFRLIGNLHSDCINIEEELAERWGNKNKFYKQHIPPTKNNVRLLKSKKKIILLRPPEEIVLAYRRAELSGVHDKIEGFQGCKSEDEWLNRAYNNGLLEELNHFYEEWKKEETKCMVISYSELLNNPTKVINKISSFFNLKSDLSNITLEKARYSKYNNMQRVFYNLSSKIGRIFR